MTFVGVYSNQTCFHLDNNICGLGNIWSITALNYNPVCHTVYLYQKI